MREDVFTAKLADKETLADKSATTEKWRKPLKNELVVLRRTNINN